MLQTIFSIKNNETKTHKIVTIIGIKLKFKRKKEKTKHNKVEINKFYNYIKAKNIINNEWCSGCSACSNICPTGAITITENKEGFMIPTVNLSKCTHCGLCNSVCPIINFSKKTKAIKHTNCYAVQAQDEIRINSSSGGVFPVVARYFLKNGGYVCGAAYSEDFKSVNHILIDEISDLPKLLVSKYVQSDLSCVFKKIKNLLENGKMVLFSGTPCQVAGLNNFLGKKYSLLYTIDVVCCGVPSRKIYRKMLDETIEFPDETIRDIKFRLKEDGWYSYAMKIMTNKNTYKIKNNESAYLQAFFKGIITNKICSVCPYDDFDRNSDITIGDYWLIGKYDKKLDDNKGTSVVLINTKKGESLLLNTLKKNFKLIAKTPSEWTLEGNSNLIKPIRHNSRRQFFFNADKLNIADNYSQCIRDKADCIVMNNVMTSINYGSILTAYAIQEILISLGYYTKLLNYKRVPLVNYENSFFQEFHDTHINLTKEVNNDSDFINLNSICDCFLVGSDQMWRTKYFKKIYEKCLLSFTDSDKTRIAIAASFGLNEFEGTLEEKQAFSKLLKRFKGISVREDSGVEILKNTFNTNGVFVLDPVFVLDKKYYHALCENSKLNTKDKLVYYGWEYSPEYKQKLEKIAKLYNCNDIINITGNVRIEDWLNAIKNARLVVSNSYHGVCFSIIFNKNFVCINNIGEGRFDSLKKLLHISDYIFNDIDDLIKENQIRKVPDYETIEKIITDEKNKFYLFLNQMLKKDKND